MADQPTQADRERALARAKQIVAWGCTLRTDDTEFAEVFVATHAENERLRAHTLSQTKRLHSLLQAVYSVLSLAACGEAVIASEIEKRLTEYDRITYGTAAQEPKMTETQAETGPSERCLPCDGMGCVHCGLFGTVKVEPRPSEEELAYQKWGSEPAIGPLDTRHIFSDGYQAGRASLAGALEAWRQRALSAEENVQSLVNTQGDDRRALEAEKAARTAAAKHTAEVKGWLDAVASALHGWPPNVHKTYLPTQLPAMAERMRQARVMPSREALARAIYETTPGSVWGDTWEAADAVLRLLAPTQAVHVERAAEATGPLELVHPSPVLAPTKDSGGEGSKHAAGAQEVPLRAETADCGPSPLVTTGASSDPPVPLPDVLPVGTRNEAGDDVSGWFLTTVGGRELYRSPGREDVFNRPQFINWTHYRAQLAQAEPLDDLPHAPVRGRVVATYKRAEEPYVPSVGERAVLVASPDPADALYFGRDGVLIERPRDWAGNALEAERQAFAFVPTGNNAAIGIHRDATWSRAQPQGEVKPGARVFAPSTAPETGDVERDDDGWPAQQPESDAAWLKRTVEELTTARPVEVREYNSSVGYGTFTVASLGQRSLCLSGSVEKRDDDAVLRSLTDHGWPLRRNARPVEPAAGPVEPATDPIEALSKRVARIEAAMDVELGAYDMRIEREERAK